MIVKTDVLRDLLYGNIDDYLGLHVVEDEMLEYNERRLILKDRPTGRFFALEYCDSDGYCLDRPFEDLVDESMYEDGEHYGVVELNNHEVKAVTKEVVVYA